MKLIDILVEELPKRGGWPKRANCITQDGELIVEPATCHPSVAKFNGEYWFLKASRIGGFEVDTLASDYTTAIITRDQYEAVLAAKNDGWIEFGGGECPVPGDTEVLIRCKSKGSWDCRRKQRADEVSWTYDDSNLDVIAYRLHQPQQADLVSVGLVDKPIDDACRVEEDLNECIGQAPVTEWNGDGLPPVGCECERSWAGDKFLPCKILFTSNQIVVVKLKESGREDSYNIGDVAFRPIRSEDECRREEAVRALMKILGGCGGPHSELKAGEIYDAIAAGKIPGVKLED